MTLCDKCNCFIGSPENRVCDIELTTKYLRPRIPPECSKGVNILKRLRKRNLSDLKRGKGAKTCGSLPKFIHPSRLNAQKISQDRLRAVGCPEDT